MEPQFREPFHLSFVSGEGDQVAPAPKALVREVRARPDWDTAVLAPTGGQFPRLHIEFHEGEGFCQPLRSISGARHWTCGHANCLCQTTSPFALSSIFWSLAGKIEVRTGCASTHFQERRFGRVGKDVKPGIKRKRPKATPASPACYSSAMGPVDALYENGLLRPVSPLSLRPGERVAVIVVRKADPARWNLARLAAHGDDDLALAEAGLDEWAAALDREDRG